MNSNSAWQDLDIISDYLSSTIISSSKNQGYAIYGSFAEQFQLLPTNIQDIDVTIIQYDSTVIEKEHRTVRISGIDYDINIEYLHYSDFVKQSVEPKYFLCYTDMETEWAISSLREEHYRNGTYRNSISSVCSKAFNKGKKKLTVQEDYDPVLGLKNLYHAIKFPILAMWYAKRLTLDEREFDVLFLTKYYNDIHVIYNNSTGTLDERCSKVLDYAKPIFNSTMTEFRKHFPKVLP